jgi:hypothetical protein
MPNEGSLFGAKLSKETHIYYDYNYSVTTSAARFLDLTQNVVDGCFFTFGMHAFSS